MKNFKRLYKELSDVTDRKNRIITELSRMMEDKLGLGWGIDTNMTEGVIIVDPDSNNYNLSGLEDILKLPREEAIEEIKRHSCD